MFGARLAHSLEQRVGGRQAVGQAEPEREDARMIQLVEHDRRNGFEPLAKTDFDQDSREHGLVGCGRYLALPAWSLGGKTQVQTEAPTLFPVLGLTKLAVVKSDQVSRFAWRTVNVSQSESARVFSLSMISAYLVEDRLKQFPGFLDGESIGRDLGF